MRSTSFTLALIGPMILCLLSCTSVEMAPTTEDRPTAPAIDREAIRKTVQVHIRDIRRCYEENLANKPELGGKVVLSWDINDQGQVADARVKEAPANSVDLTECMIGCVKEWQFQAAPAGQIVSVDYPFVFENKAKKESQ